MKKILLGALAASMLTTAASAVQLDKHFYKYGYTKPSVTLNDVQNMIDNGISYNHDGLFAKKLKKGTAIPTILNANRILNALHSKKKVIVASDGNPCLPVFEEIARQNGVKCTDLIAHLDINSKDDVDLFSNVKNTLKDIENKVSEMIKSEISEEIMKEIDKDVSKDISEAVANLVSEFENSGLLSVEYLQSLDMAVVEQARTELTNLGYTINDVVSTDGTTHYVEISEE